MYLCVFVGAHKVYLTSGDEKMSFQMRFSYQTFTFSTGVLFCSPFRYVYVDRNKLVYVWKAGIDASMKRRQKERGTIKRQKKQQTNRMCPESFPS